MAAPSEPRALVATQSGSNVNLTWQIPADLGGRPDPTYRIRSRARYGGGSWTEVAQGSIARAYTLNSVNLNEILVSIRAENPDGNSAYAAYTLPPDRPRNFQVESNYQRIRSSWWAPSNSRGSVVTGYTFQYRLRGQTLWTSNAVAANVRNFVFATSGFKRYEVRVYATNVRGDSVPVAAVEAQSIDNTGRHPSRFTRRRL